MCCGPDLSRIFLPLAAMVIQPSPPQARQEQIVTLMKCPTCTSPVSPEFSWCPRCSTALRAYPCHYCSQMISPGDKVCTFCGAPVVMR